MFIKQPTNNSVNLSSNEEKSDIVKPARFGLGITHTIASFQGRG